MGNDTPRSPLEELGNDIELEFFSQPLSPITKVIYSKMKLKDNDGYNRTKKTFCKWCKKKQKNVDVPADLEKTILAYMVRYFS